MMWSTLPTAVEMWFCPRYRDNFRHYLYNSSQLRRETAFSAFQVLPTCQWHVTSVGLVQKQLCTIISRTGCHEHICSVQPA